MAVAKDSHYIKLQTDYDGDFKVTILSHGGEILFSQTMRSHNQQIILRGFTLNLHTVTLSPIPLIL